YNVTKNKNVHVPLVQHFIAHGWEALTATVLQSNPTWSAAQRRRAERIWISRLETTIPGGLNERRLISTNNDVASEASCCTVQM
ncbi:hypothetical protein XENORESO_013733, partial [Xenotaenia resolanae]